MNQADSVARIKAEFQEKGVRVSAGLVAELESNYNAPAISTGRMVLCLEAPLGNGELIPVFIVNGKRADRSPYHLEKNSSGTFEVWKEKAKYTDVTLMPRPQFYNHITNGNCPMSKIAVIVGPGHLRSVANQRCVYQQIGQACKFCAVQHWWNAITVKHQAQIAETVEAGFREGAVKHISLTTATLATPDKGLANLVEIARMIHSECKVPTMLEFEPISDHELLGSLLRQAKEVGVTTISLNIECFDKNLREHIMPAKGKIPVEEYLKNWGIGLGIFGKNEVFTTVVVGVGEEDSSILKGVERAASQGVLTFLVPHSPAVGAIFENMEPPGADRMLRLYEKAAGIFRKYRLDLCYSTAGCIRGGGFSAIKDVARFGR
jgi:radical SAM protein (TIGR04043 family)